MRGACGVIVAALAHCAAAARGEPPKDSGWARADWVVDREVRPVAGEIPRLDVAAEPPPADNPPKNSTKAPGDSAGERRPGPLPEKKPKDDPEKPVKPRAAPVPPEPIRLPLPTGPTFAIDWATLMQLAGVGGDETRIAELKEQQARIALELAQLGWLPNLRVGMAHLHHDGFIQDVPGTVIDANKNAFSVAPMARFTIDAKAIARDLAKTQSLVEARQAGVRRVQRQRFHDAAMSFVSLQHAQAGLAIIQETHGLVQSVVALAENWEANGALTKSAADSFRHALEPLAMKAREIDGQHELAGAKLANELGIDAHCRLYAAAEQVAPVVLETLTATEDEYVARAFANGPGIEEATTALKALDDQLSVAKRFGLVPTLQFDLGYGLMSGGVGTNYSNFGSRLDTNVYVGWDLTELFRGPQNQAMFQSKRQQADAERGQLRRTLELGARTAYRTALRTDEQMREAERVIDGLRRTLKSLGNSRPGPNFTDMDTGQALQHWGAEVKCIADLAKAREFYLEALIAHNKAQVTLHLLLGGVAEPMVSAGPPPVLNPQARNAAPGGLSPAVPASATRGRGLGPIVPSARGVDIR